MSSNAIDKAARIIRQGGVIAYPTEAVFGLGCDPKNGTAVRRVLTLKQRPIKKGLVLIAAEFSQFEPFIAPLSEEIREKLLRSWPGPITWLVPARRETSSLICGQYRTLAIRVTAHPAASELCRQAHTAIISTSANLAGQPPCHTADRVKSVFGTSIDFILDAPLGQSRTPTEIRDAISGEIIRHGNNSG
ncbi:MAG: L-threonylcarbamoyladenylate synthase [Pseudomonadota bacterium]